MNTIGIRSNEPLPFRPGHREQRRVGMGDDATRGHLGDQGGLRGHSVDQNTYPWRVVGRGDGSWEVHGANGAIAYRTGDVYLAHAAARANKVLHPGGYIETCTGKGEPLNVSGDPHTVAQRLAGLLFTVTNVTTGSTHQYAGAVQQTRPGEVYVIDLATTKGKRLPVSWLACNPRLRVTLELEQFLSPHKAEVDYGPSDRNHTHL